MTKKNLSPVQCERQLDQFDALKQRYIEHKSRRDQASGMRAYARKHTGMKKDTLIKNILRIFDVSKEQLASLLEIRVDDINLMLEGKWYPYMNNAWIRIMNEPDDFTSTKLSANDKLSLDEKFELLLKRCKNS